MLMILQNEMFVYDRAALLPSKEIDSDNSCRCVNSLQGYVGRKLQEARFTAKELMQRLDFIFERQRIFGAKKSARNVSQ
jgi:hypothetical protein